MDMNEHERSTRMRPVAHRRDLTYQFPVYRWLSWLVVAGYVIGLGLMYLVAGMFGIPAPLAWAFLVILFCAGIALLDRPRLLLNVMMFYFLLMPSNRLLGLLALPLPGFLDELFFVPFIAVIVMTLIQKQVVKGGNWFPVLFGLIALLSWYVNGKPSPFVTVKILLVNLKFFIIWYFCRLTLTFKDTKELSLWCWLFIGFATIQFAYNTLWQGAPWPRIHPDLSAGVFGPDSKSAHYVGDISVVALFLLWGWNVARKHPLSKCRKVLAVLCGIIIFYDLVFMTDTKHVLVLAPIAFSGLLFLPGIPGRIKFRMLLLGILFISGASIYFWTQKDIRGYWRTLTKNFETTPKGQLFKAVTVDFDKLVPYPILGAGPGRFASTEGADSRAPLARIYITPYNDEAVRLGYYGKKGTTAISSVAGSVFTDFFFIESEFGWFGEIVYLAFWGYCVVCLYLKGVKARRLNSEAWGMYFALSSTLLLFMMLQFLNSVATVGCLAFPVWMLVGRIWDMPLAEEKPEALPLPAGDAPLFGMETL